MLARLSNGKDTEITSSNVSRSADAQNTLDSKVRISLSINDASQGPARAVLEVNGGTASRLGIKPGDRVLHPAFKAS